MLSIITAATKVRIDALSLLLLLSYSLQGARACVIQGVDSGVCITETQFAASTSFCSSYVRYPVCVPTPLPGFPQLTATAKDSWVQDQVTSYTAQRRAIESGALIPTDPTYSNYSAGATVTSRFSNPDCQRAYTAFMCYLAFPRCDPSGASVRVCQSVCENLFRSCKYDKKLWRCYNPLYYGGQAPEGASSDQITNAQGLPIYTRALFPGLPFNADGGGDEGTCTPSVPGGATSLKLAWTALSVVAILAALSAA